MQKQKKFKRILKKKSPGLEKKTFRAYLINGKKTKNDIPAGIPDLEDIHSKTSKDRHV